MKIIKSSVKYFLNKKFVKKILYWGSFMKFTDDLVKKLISSEDIILDVGARNFPYTKDIKVKKVIGIDLPSKSEGYLGWTKSSIKSIKKKKLYPIIGNCEMLPFKKNLFDKIIMIEVIEHIKNDILAIKELSKSLKNNGKIIITTPNGNEVKNTNPYHHRHYKKEQLFMILKKYFKKVNIQLYFPNQNLYIKQYLPNNSNFFKRLFWHYFYQIWNKFFNKNFNNLGYTIVAICEKPF